jgi:hypothetical protein
MLSGTTARELRTYVQDDLTTDRVYLLFSAIHSRRLGIPESNLLLLFEAAMWKSGDEGDEREQWEQEDQEMW